MSPFVKCASADRMYHHGGSVTHQCNWNRGALSLSKKDNIFSPAFVFGPSYRIVLIGGLVANGKIETLTSNSILVIRVKEGSQSRTFNGRCLKIHGPFTYLICQNIRSEDGSLAYSYVTTKFDTQIYESSALR